MDSTPNIASSHSKSLWVSFSFEQKKEITVIAEGWQAGRRAVSSEADAEDAPMEESALPSSSSHEVHHHGQARAYNTEIVYACLHSAVSLQGKAYKSMD